LRVIAKKILRDFWEFHPDCTEQLKSWYREVGIAEWKNVNELRLEFPSVSIIASNRFVFNIKGNHYRLIAKINFDFQIVWIRFIGTHKQYDKIDVTKA
jgi:mRNA interferase HigB